MTNFDPNVPLTADQVRRKIELPKKEGRRKKILFQKDAASEIKKALDKPHSKENLVITGEVGLGKEYLIKKLGEEYTKKQQAPLDMAAYINYDNELVGVLRFENGKAEKFVEKHNKTIEDIIFMLSDDARHLDIEAENQDKHYENLTRRQLLLKSVMNYSNYYVFLNADQKGNYITVLFPLDDKKGFIDVPKKGEITGDTVNDVKETDTEERITPMFKADEPLAKLMGDISQGIKDNGYDVNNTFEAIKQSLFIYQDCQRLGSLLKIDFHTLKKEKLDIESKQQRATTLKSTCEQKNRHKRVALLTDIISKLDNASIKNQDEFKQKIEEHKSIRATEIEAYKAFKALKKEIFVDQHPPADIIESYIQTGGTLLQRRLKELPMVLKLIRNYTQIYFNCQQKIERESAIKKDEADSKSINSMIDRIEKENVEGLADESKPKLKEYYESLKSEFKNRLGDIKEAQQKDAKTLASIVNRFKMGSKSAESTNIVIDQDGDLFSAIGVVEKEMFVPAEKSNPHMHMKLGKVFNAENGIYILNISELALPQALNAIIGLAKKGTVKLTDRYSAPMTEDIPLETKIVLLASGRWNYMVRSLPELSDVFRNVISLKHDIEYSSDSVTDLTDFLKLEAKKNGYLQLTKKAKEELVTFALRLSSSNEKISTQCNKYSALLADIDQKAKSHNAKQITGNHVVETLEDKFGKNEYKEHVRERLIKGSVDCYVSKQPIAGSANGLVVYGASSDDPFLMFGGITRFNAKATPGEGASYYIEKDVNLSGKIYDMSTAKVNAWFRSEFGILAKKVDFHISAEQTYGGIDGDSASCILELSRLSALSGMPISPHYAGTGSMNLMGEVMPVGGLNEKIEGAIDTFKTFDPELKAKDYVITIPASTVQYVMLRKGYADLIAEGNVKIYAVSNFEDVVKHAMGADYKTVKEKCVERLNDFKKEIEVPKEKK